MLLKGVLLVINIDIIKIDIDKYEQMFYPKQKKNICSLKEKEINMEKDDKLKALDAALSQIEKQYGKVR